MKKNKRSLGKCKHVVKIYKAGTLHRWPYKWVTEVTTLKGIIRYNMYIYIYKTGRGPTCSWFGKPTSWLKITLTGKSSARNKMFILLPLFKGFFLCYDQSKKHKNIHSGNLTWNPLKSPDSSGRTYLFQKTFLLYLKKSSKLGRTK